MEKLDKLKFKNQKGITLITLIITVVVMLILAGVAISAVVNGDGLFSKTRQAAEIYNNSVNDESNQINKYLEWIDNYIETQDIKLSYKKTNIDEYATEIDLKTEISSELLILSYEEYAQGILSGITTNEEKENLLVEGSNYMWNMNYDSINDIYVETGCNSLEELSSMMEYNSVDEMLIGEGFVRPQGYDFENNCSKPILYVNGILEKDYGLDTLESYIYIASTNGEYVFTVVVGNMSKSITVNVDGLEKIEYEYLYELNKNGDLLAIDVEGNIYISTVNNLILEISEYTNTHFKFNRINKNLKVKEIIGSPSLGNDYILGQDNNLYLYDSYTNTFKLMLDGVKVSEITSLGYVLSENGEVYKLDEDSIQKLDFGNVIIAHIDYNEGITNNGEVYDLATQKKISENIKVKELKSGLYTYFISESGDLYYDDYYGIIKLNDDSTKFERFFNGMAIATNGDIYTYDTDEPITNIGIKVDNVKSVGSECIILKDGSIYNPNDKEFETLVNNEKINVKIIENSCIIDENNEVYVLQNSELIKLDVKGKKL